MKNKHLPTTELLHCNEVEIHYTRPVFSSMRKISHSRDVVTIIREYHDRSFDVKEHAWLLTLSAFHQVLTISTISIGSVRSCPINIKEIIQIALLTHASNLVLVHNHPSGNITFSEADKAITKKLHEACVLFDINLLDHIVITTESYSSMVDNRLSPFT